MTKHQGKTCAEKGNPGPWSPLGKTLSSSPKTQPSSSGHSDALAPADPPQPVFQTSQAKTTSLHRPEDFWEGCGQVCSGEQAEIGTWGRWTFLPSSEHEGSSPLTRGSASLVNNPSNGGEGVGSRARLCLQQLPQALTQ